MPGGVDRKRLNKVQLIALLPTCTEAIKETLLNVGIKLQNEELGDDDDADVASDGEPDVDGNRGMDQRATLSNMKIMSLLKTI